jgi:large subunit ribosomal protein L9
MEVILLENHQNLGQRGDIVNVARGYARNYLIPKKIAVPNTQANTATIKAVDQSRNIEVNKEEESALKIKEELDGLTIEIKAKSGKEGKLFGSITNKNISEALEEKGFKIDKRHIKLEEPIKELGNYSIEISLFQDIKVNLNLLVEEENDKG